MRTRQFYSCLLILLFGAICQQCNAQDSLIDFLFRRIASQQVNADSYFLPGIYPSFISKNGKYNTRKKDNNIFYNCLVAYTLDDIRPFVSRQNQRLTDSMLESARPLFARFKNRKRDTYNFWRTDSSFDFPFPTIFNLYRKDVSLPDDMDCTVLSLLALHAPDSVAAAVHTLLQRFVNDEQHRVRSVIPMFDSLPAYSTWLGIKFPVVIDVSVLCNVLTYVQSYNLSWTKADSASLRLIVQTISNNDHLRRPVYSSPVYPTTAIMLYHIARLMKVKPIPALEKFKRKLVTDAGRELVRSKSIVEQILLCNAILKWGYQPPPLKLPVINDIPESLEQDNYSFFIANLPSYFKDFLKVVATRKKLGYYDYYCPAFNDALLLEYLVLTKHP